VKAPLVYIYNTYLRSVDAVSSAESVTWVEQRRSAAVPPWVTPSSLLRQLPGPRSWGGIRSPDDKRVDALEGVCTWHIHIAGTCIACVSCIINTKKYKFIFNTNKWPFIQRITHKFNIFVQSTIHLFIIYTNKSLFIYFKYKEILIHLLII